jgi:hypothetical protein
VNASRLFIFVTDGIEVGRQEAVFLPTVGKTLLVRN